MLVEQITSLCLVDGGNLERDGSSTCVVLEKMKTK